MVWIPTDLIELKKYDLKRELNISSLLSKRNLMSTNSSVCINNARKVNNYFGLNISALSITFIDK